MRPAITYNFDQSYKLNLMKIHKNIRKRYSRTEPPNDYLKYWRVIRRWVKSNYGLGTVELEMLLFLYSESYFTKDTFDEYNQLMSWNKKRFSDLLRDGWIHVFRKRKGNQKKPCTNCHTKEERCSMPYTINLTGKNLQKRNQQTLCSKRARHIPMWYTVTT